MNWYKKAMENAEGHYIPNLPGIPVDVEKVQKTIDEIDLSSKWIPVDSSFISYVAYYAPLKILEVKLRSGREYSYKGVSKKVYNAFMKAKSKGTFFNKLIKQNYPTMN